MVTVLQVQLERKQLLLLLNTQKNCTEHEEFIVTNSVHITNVFVIFMAVMYTYPQALTEHPYGRNKKVVWMSR